VGEIAMSDVENWQEKASMLRELAKYTLDADAKRVLLVLAEDCEEISAKMTSFRGTLRPRRPDEVEVIAMQEQGESD
jgi:chlorite dismutase